MRRTNVLLLLILISFSARSQQGSVGIFEAHGDVGNNVMPGSAVFIPATGQYVISGAGYNIWGDHDEFQFVWKKMKGDFILYTRAEFLGNWIEQHRKVGWMVRKSLDGKSPHVNAVEHGDGLTSLQFRRTTGAQTEEHRLKLTKANILQLERKGDRYIMRAAQYGQPFQTDTISGIDLGDEVYVGLFVGSHDADKLETGVFSNVNISIPMKGESNENTGMTLGSNLEILELASGRRDIIYSVPYSIQAPNWTPDGRNLIFNDAKGTIYRFDLASRTPTPINTGTITHNNNDHVLSFDGKMLGLSSSVRELGGSIIYTVPIEGGTPQQVTPKGPSYLHGWSPDGKDLVFCGERDGEFDVYKVPAAGGKEIRLTTNKGLDDGPEYTPDGKYIYFNSVRTGLMQIWRMRPDGSQQEQITSDNLNNWFAHISPDGKWFVYLSFLKEETPANIHPPYKHVYIRLLPIDGRGEPRVLAYLYGGQGSINTPSWSPDGKKIAFVSNSDMTGK
ncbi:biopolymer transporter TolR [Flavitalea sp. BT771]|uniref:TolB family protein n=1 Tax=Flavitalea sp. BT771 TaxID=3063329 RepID=UPI0026E13D31|nr:biopolymer transporter TolR [Flavitalea sp. BT771]MDO6433450.1 biopolymer transporter TolR [Flavitalea sp. BT771]MDV6222645.1 biopolymer transporter TolR [Flavitalea sp. BT771]